MDALVEIEELSKTFGGFRAVRDVSLSVAAGEAFALLGPNGAGKTTTIRMLIGLLEPTSGRARIGGLDCFHRRAEVMRLAGYLPDDPIFYEYLRGGEVLRFAADMHGHMLYNAVQVAAAALRA
jgi:ABC-2 type transport system ATP-binding protein